MKRKRHRRKPASHRKNTLKIRTFSVAAAICFSILAGYITATQFIGPALGIESKPVFFDSMSEKYFKQTEKEESEVKEDKQVVKDQLDVQTERGFALQYGSFTEKEGAQECANDLKSRGIEVSIIERDGSYKVIGEVFETKEEARVQKESSAEGDEIFITEIP